MFDRSHCPIERGKPCSSTRAQLLLMAALCCAGCDVYENRLLNNVVAADAGAPAVSASPDAGRDREGVRAADFDPTTCHGGQCWWSTAAAEGCGRAGAPRANDRPSGADSAGSVGEFYLGFTRVRLGTTNREGNATDDAWEDFGLDLDGVCTNSSTCQGTSAVSCRAAVAALPYDGQLCRDNTFARLQPVVAKVPEIGERFGLSEDVINCALWRGSYNTIVRITGYDGTADDAQVRVDFYASNGIQEPLAWNCPSSNFREDYPRWPVSRKWRISEADLTRPVTSEGSLPDSKVADAHAYVKHGYLVAQIPDDAEQGFLGDNAPYRGFVFKSRGGQFIGNLVQAQDGTWEIHDGLTAGRLRKEDLGRAFREVGFCDAGESQSFYEEMLTYLDENADLLASGENDPQQPCDALSYGIGFEAAQVTPGASVLLPARLECCAPGKTPEECSATCNDGMVNGDEKCDTGIAAGKPGACPTTCAPIDACTPTTLSGKDCATQCVPAPISAVGTKDGCCPAGANANQDVDCAPACGNGVIENGESCDPTGSCPACNSDNPCVISRATGSADTCNLSCQTSTITQCRNGDRCCPSGCSRNNDQDCSNSCGNGQLDSGETCENGSNKPCPTSCDDMKACTADSMQGSTANCNVTCRNVPITQPANGDGCCPNNANAANDNDCLSQCGNGVVEGNEKCDDGNQTAGDGCANCQVESVQQACLATLNSSTACSQCTCQKCADQIAACQGNANAGDALLCRNMADCALRSGCRNPDCLCGTSDRLSCAAGNTAGPCVAEVFAAAKTNSPFQVDSRVSDTGYPLGRAIVVGDCVDRNCATECAMEVR